MKKKGAIDEVLGRRKSMSGVMSADDHEPDQNRFDDLDEVENSKYHDYERTNLF